MCKFPCDKQHKSCSISAMEQTLCRFIDEVGDKAAAEIAGISVRTAASYRLGERVPRPDIAQRFVDTGRVTWEGIYKPASKPAAA